MSPNSPSLWKKGSVPRSSTIKKIADYFGVDIAYFTESGSGGISEGRVFMDTLTKLCREKNITPFQLYKQLGVTSKESGNWARAVPSDEMLQRIADVLGVPKERLIPQQRPQIVLQGAFPARRDRLPLLGTVACGEPQFAEEQYNVYAGADNDSEADFCLVARGDSMIGARIYGGDILFVKQQDIVDDGEIAVVLIDDDTTVKRVYYDREHNTVTLQPENPKYKPMRYTGEQLDHIRILGKVVGVHVKIW